MNDDKILAMQHIAEELERTVECESHEIARIEAIVRLSELRSVIEQQKKSVGSITGSRRISA